MTFLPGFLQKKWAFGHFFFKSGQAVSVEISTFVRVAGQKPTFFSLIDKKLKI